MVGHPARPMTRRSSGAVLLPCGLLALAAYGSSYVSTAFTFRVLPARRCTLARRALPDAELAHQIQALGAPLQGWADAVASEVGFRAAEAADLFGPSQPAFAADAPVLDPNTKYVMGPDGNVLIDPMSNKPITDDWWNGIIGFQADLIKGLDSKLREFGVAEAFGWTIVLYTLFVKVLFYPLQSSQLKSTAMMQLLQPKVKEVQERYKNDPETQNRLVGQLYQAMEVNPLAGCLPVFIQIPLFWSLYGVWRRLSAEQFPHYAESWLWVPSLAKPNPDFQFKLDWLMEFQDGAPVMGWNDYLCYLIFPALLVGFTLVSTQQTQAGKTSSDSDGNLIMKVLPFISVYFIGALSLELPQAVSVYYATNTVLTLAQTSLTKYNLRQEIPGYEEFERTGKFPESAFESAVMSKAPTPKTLHEAAVRGNLAIVKELYEGDGAEAAETGKVDINAWDEKEIAPIGYAVACGKVDIVRYFIEKGANLQVLDGQKNTLLHYAAGYGHKEVLEVLLEAGSDIWPDNEWSQWRNAKNQTVVDAACANRKGAILDFLSEKLVASADSPSGMEEKTLAEVVKARTVLLQAQKKAEETEGKTVEVEGKTAEAEPVASTSAPQQPAAGAKIPAEQAKALQSAMAELKANPKAVEQAKAVMSKMPPQLLSMLSGNKMSPEQAKKYMENIQNMSTEDIMGKVDDAGDLLAKGGVAAVAPAAGSAAAAPRREGKSVPARAVD